MSIIYVLIPVALLLLGVAVWALFWAVRSGQFDDLDSQGWNVVLDDDERPPGDGPVFGRKESEASAGRSAGLGGPALHDPAPGAPEREEPQSGGRGTTDSE